MKKTEVIAWRLTSLKREAVRLAQVRLGAASEAEVVDHVMTNYLESRGYLRDANELLGSNALSTEEQLPSTDSVTPPTLLFREKSEEKKERGVGGVSAGGKGSVTDEVLPSNALAGNNGKPEPELSPAQLAMLPKAQQLKALIERACSPEYYSLGAPPANDERKCAVVLEQVVRLDGVREADIWPLAMWMLQDDFWQNNMLSIPAWRKKSKSNDRVKILNARDAWKKAGSPGTGRNP